MAPRIAPSPNPSDDAEDRSDEVQTIRDQVEDKTDAAREKVRDKADAAKERLQDTTSDVTGDEDDSAGTPKESDEDDDSPTTTTRPRPGVLDPAVQALKPVTGLLGG